MMGPDLERRVREPELLAATVVEMLEQPPVKNAEEHDRALGWLLDAEWETSAPLESADHAEALALLTELLQGRVRIRRSAPVARMNETLFFVPVPEFARVRRLNMSNFERASLFADLCRLNALSMIAYAGSGHIGSSFSSLDIFTWLLLHELRGADKAEDGAPDLFFSSKGHDAPGLYAAMIALGLLPAENLRKLRRLGGLPGHPDVGTPNIVTNTGSLGMGISKAKGMAFADQLLGRDRRIFVMTGDGELQEGQIWESLISAANHRLDRITVIVDHNKLQSDIWVEETSHLGDLEAKFAAFGWDVRRCDGHDFAALAAVLDEMRERNGKPKIIIADTVKGRGVSFMESTAMAEDQALYRFHSGAPDQQLYTRAAEELIARVERRARLGRRRCA